VAATISQKLFGQFSALMLPSALDMIDLRIAHYDRSVDPARPEYHEHVVFSFWHDQRCPSALGTYTANHPVFKAPRRRMGKSNRSVLGLASSTRQYIARRVFSHSATEKELQNFQRPRLSGVLIGPAHRSGRHRHR